MEANTSQTDAIRSHLKSGRGITPIEALRQYGCMRLGARIWDLRKEGMPIRRDLVKAGRKRYAEYSLEKQDA